MTVKNGENRQFKRDERGRFVKGTAPGPGRKCKDFFTYFKKAAKEVAEKLGIENWERIYIELLKEGIKESLKGDYRFWKEIVERSFGKVPEKIEMDTKIEEIKRIEEVMEKILEKGKNDEANKK